MQCADACRISKPTRIMREVDAFEVYVLSPSDIA